jgi:tetratricopeptide (TPR) repeat protein
MASPDPVSSPGELGRLGLACLERYETDGDTRALASGLARLEEAVASAPGHPDRMRWWYGLGSAYESRADERGSAEDYDRAIGWYARLHRELPAEDPDRAFIALALTGAQWSRYWLLRYGGGGEPADCAGLVEEVMAALRRWPVETTDPEAAAYVRMIRGLTHQERYDARQDPADLSECIWLLAGALPELPEDTPWIAVAAFTLAAAYWDRFVATDDRYLLDLAIDTGTRAIELAGEEYPTWLSAQEHLALCVTERWRLSGDRADLDQAVSTWRIVLDREEDAWSAALAGGLMREHAELTGDPVEAAEAVRLIGRAVHECPDDGTAAERWYELGRAHCTQWTVAAVTGSLEAAGRCLGNVLTFGLPDGAPVVGRTLAELANLARLYHDRGALVLASRSTGGRTQALADLSTAVAISRSVLERVPTGDPKRVPALLVAVLAGWAEFTHTGSVERFAGLEQLTAELVAAQPAGTDLHDLAVTMRGAVLAEQVKTGNR